ncbi:MAG TPA: biopolymer transporter TolR [Verrucomicrobiae bacterium]|nr:biopolymer transporter TolR [Verrucomicrobiae bacterium]
MLLQLRLDRRSVFVGFALFLTPTRSFAVDTALGEFDSHLDIGGPRLAGMATYNAVSQEYAVAASGLNMWASRDEFHFLRKRIQGDFILQARVEFIGTGVDPHRKLGWMARASLDADAAYADGTVHGDGLTSLQYRRSQGAITEQVKSTVTNPDFLQLERKGNTYIFSAARFGDELSACQMTNLVLGDAPEVGLFLCSHNSNVTERAIFRDVRVIRPAKSDFVPYHDYIGSHLEILEISTGRRQLLHSSAQPFEAPNWTPDGAALIYNGSGRGETRGRLFRFDLARRQPALIDTAFANRNNNDHVLSFDGTQIGISHQNPSHDGRSAIYTVPVNGGVPRLVTSNAPSYLHGWSPDGQFLIYTGERNKEFDIYRIPASGGEEVRLTTAKGLDDGPEYTPDGQFIYFNSARSGTMQIWRMKADGSDQEQITHDALNNWFPHVSPDGKWIAFLSFSKDVPPADHPYYKQVYLRLMPRDGGAAKVVAYVYGGQGTFNVPSWSPDSRRVAFVSNSDLTLDSKP